MHVLAIPIVAEIFGTLFVAGLTAAVLHYRLREKAAEVEAEIERMERAYRHARESMRR